MIDSPGHCPCSVRELSPNTPHLARNQTGVNGENYAIFRCEWSRARECVPILRRGSRSLAQAGLLVPPYKLARTVMTHSPPPTFFQSSPHTRVPYRVPGGKGGFPSHFPSTFCRLLTLLHGRPSFLASHSARQLLWNGM